jgi:hypothetical protein
MFLKPIFEAYHVLFLVANPAQFYLGIFILTVLPPEITMCRK